MTIRTLVEADLDTLRTLIEQQPTANTVTPDRFTDHLAAGMYRPNWIWVDELDGVVRAAAIWWGLPDEDHPFSIDGLYHVGDGDPVPVWTELIRSALAGRPAGAEPPEYHFFLDSDWEQQPEVVAALELRTRAAAGAGLTAVTDRLRYEWRPAYGLPERSARLRFEPADDEAFVAAFVRVSEGSLDAATARSVARVGAEAAAREDLAVYRTLPNSDRSWWRLGYDAAGRLVGFTIPSANAGGLTVGYVGVLPEHRGQHFVDDLLAELTRSHADRGAERLTADTDFGNVPMARSFDRLGYRVFAVRRVLSVPAD